MSDEIITNVDDNVPVKPDGLGNPQRNITEPRGFAMYRNEGNAYLNGSVNRMAASLRAEVFAEEIDELAVISGEDFGDPKPVQEEAPEQIVLPEAISLEEPVPTVQEKKVRKEYDKKRILPLILILLVNILVVRIAVVGLFDAGSFGQYVSPFVKASVSEKVAVPVLDALFSLLKTYNIDAGIETVLQYQYNADTLSNIAFYATAIASAVMVVFALVNILCALVALVSGKHEGRYRKVRFGLTAILSFVMVVVLYFGMLIINAEPLDVCALFVVDYIGLPLAYETGSTLFAGYGLYALIFAPILTFICSCCAYRKSK